MNLEIDTESATVKRGEYVIFRAKVGYGYEGDISAFIDDVTEKLDDYFDIECIGIERKP